VLFRKSKRLDSLVLCAVGALVFFLVQKFDRTLVKDVRLLN
jgi:hypothetical protein